MISGGGLDRLNLLLSKYEEMKSRAVEKNFTWLYCFSFKEEIFHICGEEVNLYLAGVNRFLIEWTGFLLSDACDLW